MMKLWKLWNQLSIIKYLFAKDIEYIIKGERMMAQLHEDPGTPKADWM